MAKFSQIAKGAAARHPVTFPLLSGQEVTCAVVPLIGEAEADVLTGARAFAVSRGVADPKAGEPIYELGLWIHTLVRGCVDADSPEDKPEPFFDGKDADGKALPDGGVQQILDPRRGLDRDRIALLFQAQQAWQDECAPGPKTLDPAQYLAEVYRHAGVPEGLALPLEEWRHAMRRSFMRSTCKALVDALQLKSLFGSLTQDTPRSSTSSPRPAPEGDGAGDSAGSDAGSGEK